MDKMGNRILPGVVNSEKQNGLNRKFNTPRGNHFQKIKMD